MSARKGEFPIVDDLRALQACKLWKIPRFDHPFTDEQIWDLAKRGFLQQWPASCGSFGFTLSDRGLRVLAALDLDAT
jgi:hypothetical protein